MPSAANTPYFAYFFKNINSSIFEWFGYASTTSGMLMQESSYWLYIASYFIVISIFIYLLRRLFIFFWKRINESHTDSAAIPFLSLRLAVTIVFIGGCVFGIRGRVGYNPIKISEAYYCNDSFLNQLGINPAFNLLTSSLDDMRKENKEIHLMPYGKAITMARTSLGITGKVDSLNVLGRDIKACGTPKKHNVVVILMESMSGSLMQTFGQKEPLTPTLDSLFNHSLAFTNCYSAGIHTNQGMTATLYSFPAIMSRNLMKGTVTPHRDGIPTVLKKYGYHNLFFMTHEAQYDNMKAFFSTNGYDDIYSQENYPKNQVVNSFGVSDHFLFNYSLPVINKAAKRGKPFFATLLTISNHPPYVIPPYFHAKTSKPETQIVEYADWAIGDFLRKAKQQPWYKNTIFVILADHGKLVGNSNCELPVSYNHIPLMIFGAGVPVVKINHIMEQIDVMPTLLHLLNMSYKYNGFGINAITRKRIQAFYSADNEIVARDASRCYIYNPSMKKSFCYDVATNGKLRQNKNINQFSYLRNYVFSMTQTAEYATRKSRLH
jgi:phosphoglycerol transferase MdoB-like AlkP superfamily enzyme